MIRPAGLRGGAFGDSSDGDARSDPDARRRMSRELGISADWAWLRQIHGADVAHVTRPGHQGDGDAAFTAVAGLPLAIATADCYPVIIEADDAVGIAHAGWRGADAGVITALRRGMEHAGHRPARAAVGPGIGACCFEVGPEVTGRFPHHLAITDWGTPAVDLAGVMGDALDGLDVWVSGTCTMSDPAYHSYRRDGTVRRQVAVAWLPV